MSDDDIITTKEVAALLDVSESTVRRLADKGVLACYRTSPIGGHRRFSKLKVISYRDKLYPDDSIRF